MIAVLNVAAWLFVAAIFVGVAWLVLDSKVGAKSVGPEPHIPPGLDVAAFRATVTGVEQERRAKGVRR